MTAVDGLRTALAHVNVQAFLRVIRAGETHPDDDEAYQAVFGWRPGNGVIFSDFADHPRRAIKSPWGWTSAAGAFQAMCAVPPLVKTDTWGDFVRWCSASNYAPTFGREDQDLFAAWCIRRRGALEDVIAGRLEAAVHKCAKEWASFPGSPYGQPTKTMPQLWAVYRRYGGGLATDAPPAIDQSIEPVNEPAPMGGELPPESATVHYSPSEWDMQNPPPPPPPEKPMAAPLMFLKAALPYLIEAVPRLGRLFGSGSEVSERNLKAVEMAADTIKAAVGASTEQEAIERLRADPQARAAADQAIAARWYELVEAGGGGIEGAHKRSMAYLQPGAAGFWLNPSFWISIILVTMPMMLLVDVFYVHPETYVGELRTQIVTGVLMVIGMVGGYWIGTSISSARKDERGAA